MVTDSLKNLGMYLPDQCKDKVIQWIEQNITKEIPVGEYPIDGEKIFARVFSYRTKNVKECKIEAHNNYVDIQSVISGEEGIQVYHRELLVSSEKYEKEKDVEFFQPSSQPFSGVNVKEGCFAMLFPWEAHQPEISFNGTCPVIKKFVIKIKENLYE